MELLFSYLVPTDITSWQARLKSAAVLSRRAFRNHKNIRMELSNKAFSDRRYPDMDIFCGRRIAGVVSAATIYAHVANKRGIFIRSLLNASEPVYTIASAQIIMIFILLRLAKLPHSRYSLLEFIHNFFHSVHRLARPSHCRFPNPHSLRFLEGW